MRFALAAEQDAGTRRDVSTGIGDLAGLQIAVIEARPRRRLGCRKTRMARCRGVFRHGLSLVARDQADAAAELKIGPEPIEKRRNSISDAQHEAYMHDAPQPPSRCAPQLE